MNIFGTSFNYQGRLAKIRKLMDEQETDCLLVHNWVNQYYISGFYHHLPWYPICHRPATEAPLVVFRNRDHEPVFLCAYNIMNALKEGTWMKDVRVWDRTSRLSIHAYLAEILKEKGVEQGKIGIEEEVCTARTLKNLQKALPGAQFKDATEIFKRARLVKEPEEIELIKEAVSIAESALKVAMDVAKPGVSEMEVQRAMEIEMRRRGSLREVETMIQSGIRTVNYRAFGTEWKMIEKNDLVLADLGCVYKGYGSDITRTWVVGTPTQEQKKIAQDLYRAHEKTLAFIKPGLKYREVVSFARNELTAAGYPIGELSFPCQQFAFHGLGLGPFHDPPEAENDQELVLEPGMVLSIQACVREKTFNVRFEDDAVLTPEGLELISRFPRELI